MTRFVRDPAGIPADARGIRYDRSMEALSAGFHAFLDFLQKN
jgi:hypothetical protein